MLNYFFKIVLLLFLVSFTGQTTKDAKVNNNSEVQAIPKNNSSEEYKDMNQRWYDVIYQTDALRMNKELAKINLKQVDEITLHEFTNCCYTKINSKYPDIYKLIDKDGVLNKKYTDEFN